MKLPLTLLLLAFVLASALPCGAQVPDPRYGLGVNTMVSSEDGFGIGLRGRASFPINSDVSAAADVGVTGFVFGGRDDADYIFDPQLSAIIMLPGMQERTTYVLFGLGAYVPLGSGGDAGPTVHLGLGRAHALQESSFFYEIDPALVIGQDHVDVAVPIRIGIIF